MRDWRNTYRFEIKGSVAVVALPEKKRGRPLLLEKELCKLAYWTNFRDTILANNYDKGCVVS